MSYHTWINKYIAQLRRPGLFQQTRHAEDLNVALREDVFIPPGLRAREVVEESGEVDADGSLFGDEALVDLFPSANSVPQFKDEDK